MISCLIMFIRHYQYSITPVYVDLERMVLAETYPFTSSKLLLTIALGKQFYTGDNLDKSDRLWHHAQHPYRSLDLTSVFKNVTRFFFWGGGVTVFVSWELVLVETITSATYSTFNFYITSIKFVLIDSHCDELETISIY